MHDRRGTLLTLAVLAAAGAAWAADDDLAVVKRAVASPSPAVTTSATSSARSSTATTRREPQRTSESRTRVRDRVTVIEDEEPPAPPERSRMGGRAPQWLKVRVVERGKRGHVLVNLPLGVARALGDDFPIDVGCHRGRGCASLRLGDILRELQVGHRLVEIEDDDTTVRVWVE